MLEKADELFSKEYKSIEDMEALIKEKLGIGFEDCAVALSASLAQRADELVDELPSVAPYGDYGKLMEEPSDISTFLKTESIKTENWKISAVQIKKTGDQLIEFIFTNSSVDEGDVLKGFVFVGLSGKIRHSFCQVG